MSCFADGIFGIDDEGDGAFQTEVAVAGGGGRDADRGTGGHEGEHVHDG